MSNNVKFDRRVNIRTRDSDLKIFWYAVAAALAAHLIFFGAFNYRRAAQRGDKGGDAVMMLTEKDFPKAQRKWFRRWMAYNDPRNSGRAEFGEKLIGDKMREAVPDRIREPSNADIPTPSAEIGKFREVPGRKLPSPTYLPAPPRGELPPPVVSGSVTDGEGRPLPLGGLKLPARTPRTTERTVLRVFKSGSEPVLLLERSCGDPNLDDFAIRELLFLARDEAAPEFMIVEWPEARK